LFDRFYHPKKINHGKKTTMPIINPNYAGIDVGSKSHYVAIGQSMRDVREFGVYAVDLTAMAQNPEYLFGIKQEF